MSPGPRKKWILGGFRQHYTLCLRFFPFTMLNTLLTSEPPLNRPKINTADDPCYACLPTRCEEVNPLKAIILLIILAVTNTGCLLLMRYDKQCAWEGKRRIPEKTLFLSAGMFGALGGVIAMQHYHHKTRHRSFRVYFPVMLGVQLLILGGVVMAGIV